MTRSLNTKSALKLFTFRSKYPTIKDLIEKLYLIAIIEAYHWIRENENITDLLENEIKNKFIKHFKHINPFLKEYINNYTIILTAENQVYTEQEIHRTDFEFISSYHENKFVVECKRLTSAETRYIHGTTDKNGEYKIDGLEKFIDLIYSQNDNYAGMIGFIIKGDPLKISNKIKDKVGDFHPVNGIELLLKQRCTDWKMSFQSKHLKKNKSEIHMYHLFFDFII